MMILCKTVAFLLILIFVYSFIVAEKWWQRAISLVLIIVAILGFIAIL